MKCTARADLCISPHMWNSGGLAFYGDQCCRFPLLVFFLFFTNVDALPVGCRGTWNSPAIPTRKTTGTVTPYLRKHVKLFASPPPPPPTLLVTALLLILLYLVYPKVVTLLIEGPVNANTMLLSVAMREIRPSAFIFLCYQHVPSNLHNVVHITNLLKCLPNA
jgi:hypothetical protein